MSFTRNEKNEIYDFFISLFRKKGYVINIMPEIVKSKLWGFARNNHNINLDNYTVPRIDISIRTDKEENTITNWHRDYSSYYTNSNEINVFFPILIQGQGRTGIEIIDSRNPKNNYLENNFPHADIYQGQLYLLDFDNNKTPFVEVEKETTTILFQPFTFTFINTSDFHKTYSEPDHFRLCVNLFFYPLEYTRFNSYFLQKIKPSKENMNHILKSLYQFYNSYIEYKQDENGSDIEQLFRQHPTNINKSDLLDLSIVKDKLSQFQFHTSNLEKIRQFSSYNYSKNNLTLDNYGFDPTINCNNKYINEIIGMLTVLKLEGSILML